jgi:predicted SAM-dependent methyltransferase
MILDVESPAPIPRKAFDYLWSCLLGHSHQCGGEIDPHIIVRAAKALIPSGAKRAIKRHIYASKNQRLLGEASAQGALKLHLACGLKILVGWLNVDVAPYPGAMTISMPAGLRIIPDRAAQYAYCSHMLHYLEYPSEASAFVLEVYRLLKPGGVFRVVVPNIEAIIRAYVENDEELFKDQVKHHWSWATTKLEHLICAMRADYADGSVKYGYDLETLTKLLKGAGFNRVVQSAFNKSEFEPLRIDYRGKTSLAIIVDAVK